jgi:hypothetical protein
MQELPVVFAQLHGLMAAHSRVFTRLLPAEEAVLSDILSEVHAHTKAACMTQSQKSRSGFSV